MTCEHALNALLDADLPDMIGGTTPLAMHVRGCSRCRRVAEQLMGDTRLLANAVVAALVPRRRVSIGSVAFVPAAVAVALLVMVTMRQPSHDTRSTVVTLPATVVNAPPTQPNATITVPARRAAPSRQLRAFPRAQPVAAVKLIAPVAIDQPRVSSGVAVSPPSGANALVMHTSDPKLVVVWLY